jgi:hypoxanthine phosphoribosyltransferase
VPVRHIIDHAASLSYEQKEFPLLSSSATGDACYDAAQELSWPRVVRFWDGSQEPLFIGGILTAAEILRITRKIARDLVERYRGQHLLLIQILEGGVPFCAMVCEALAYYAVAGFHYDLASIKVSSYLEGTHAHGHQVSQPLHCNGNACSTLEGYDQVLILDDLLDAGNTFAWLVDHYLPSFKPKQISAYFMVEKERKRLGTIDKALERSGAVCGKQVPDEWVVGYGLDICLPGRKGQQALHLFRNRLPGGVYAFNSNIEKKLLSDYQEHPEYLLEQLGVFISEL